jgi:hypothetical protein
VEDPQYQAELLQQQSSALPSPSRQSSLSSTPNPPARRKRIQGAYSKCQQSNSGSADIPIPVSSKSHSLLYGLHCCISCINILWGGQ